MALRNTLSDIRPKSPARKKPPVATPPPLDLRGKQPEEDNQPSQHVINLANKPTPREEAFFEMMPLAFDDLNPAHAPNLDDDTDGSYDWTDRVEKFEEDAKIKIAAWREQMSAASSRTRTRVAALATTIAERTWWQTAVISAALLAFVALVLFLLTHFHIIKVPKIPGLPNIPGITSDNASFTIGSGSDSGSSKNGSSSTPGKGNGTGAAGSATTAPTSTTTGGGGTTSAGGTSTGGGTTGGRGGSTGGSSTGGGGGGGSLDPSIHYTTPVTSGSVQVNPTLNPVSPGTTTNTGVPPVDNTVKKINNAGSAAGAAAQPVTSPVTNSLPRL